MLEQITPLLLCYNEEANLPRTLASLAWAQDIVVVDSGSSDATRAILRAQPRVRCFQRPFDTHARQWNYALQKTAIASEWVLALDADHVLSPGLVEELRALRPSAGIAGYRISYRYCIAGRPLRASLYPPLIALYRRSAAFYVQDGHTQRVQVQGAVGELSARIFHDDRKPLRHWLSNQRRYANLEARHLKEQPWRTLKAADRFRALFLGPLLVLPYCLVLRGLILDGWRGLAYSLQRFYAELLLARALLRHRLSR